MTEEIKNTPLADFDWEAFEKGDAQNSQSREELTKAYDETLNVVKDKEVTEGTVIALNKREAVVNIGYKSDGVIPVSEFRYNPDLKVGDKVEVFVENPEDRKGQLILSHKKARQARSWDRVNAALENDEIIKGYIKCRTKGGMIVDVFGIEAFLPGSQIDVKPIRDYDQFVDTTMDFKIVKINQDYRNVVVSHKALIEAELEQQRKEIIEGLQKGQICEGTVKNITSYGVFIDLGGIDGLIHITDLSWGRITHPEEIVSLDQKLNVVILDFDEEKKRIALGLKQLQPHPWEALDPDLKVGDKVKGKVVVMTDYGAFIEVAPGVEGLIHVSEMSWSAHLRSAQDFMKVGDEVEAVILTLDREERKMSLGIKQLKSDPWESIEEKYPIGSKHTARVRNFTNFGVFVEIEEGVDGLIHISDLSWTKKIKHPSEFTQIGAEIEDGRPFAFEWFDGFTDPDVRAPAQFCPPPEIDALYAKTPWGERPHEGKAVKCRDGWILQPHGADFAWAVRNDGSVVMPPVVGPAPTHYHEYLNCIIKGCKAATDFSWSTYMRECVIAGEIAERVPGVKLAWDAKARRFDNEAANAFLTRQYRAGWEIPGLS